MNRFRMVAAVILGAMLTALVAGCVVEERRCAYGWVPAHRDYYGRWIPGHCR